MTLALTSTAFGHGDGIPARYTCTGEDVSPPLAWSGIPAAARSLALVVDDPDAPDPRAPRRVWVHWILYNLPPDLAGLAEGMSPDRLPPGAGAGLNDWHRAAYGGPCPPVGRHRYYFRLHALDTVLAGLATPTRAELEAAMHGHVIGQAELMGTFGK